MEKESVEQTYINVLGQQLVCYTVLVDDVVIHSGTRGRGAEQEAQDSVAKEGN